MPSRWSDDLLTTARLEGDVWADGFMATLLMRPPGAPGESRGSYNHLLDLATALVAHPELALIPSSLLRAGLDKAGDMAGFFSPIEAPSWVDAQRLKRASDLWQSESLLCIAVLYAASLPSCYLMKQGVPALYATEKLSEQCYLYQRIFETGLMLEAVMRPGGINVIEDVEPNADAVMARVLNTLDHDGRWSWQHYRLMRGAADGGSAGDAVRVRQAFETAMQPKRYIWGAGLVAAQKVRLLHAAIRFMLQNPNRPPPVSGLPEQARSYSEQATHRATAWDETLGTPINQEDLAFVLLTFGYLIPKGMETWGRKVPREEKEAFLHLWRVVGHTMGLREDLMTDNLDEAAGLYEQILARNAGSTAAGQILTTAVMGFLGNYLGSRFGFKETIPPMLIIDQLGLERAQLIITPSRYRAARRPVVRLVHGAIKAAARIGFWLHQHILVHVPFVGNEVATLTQRAADALIDSWRDSFRRKPFYVPADETSWVRETGVTPEYEASLMQWRERLFNTIAVGLGALVVSGLAAILALVFFLQDMPLERNIALVGCAVMFALGYGILRRKVSSVAKERPRLDPIGAQ